MPFYGGQAISKVDKPIHLERAVRTDDEIWARECLNRGRDPNGHDGLGTTPLMEAAQKGNLACVKLLIEYGANVNFARRGEAFDGSKVASVLADGRNALCDAAAHGHVEVVETLIAANADVDLPGPIGRAALSWAVIFSNTNPRGRDTINVLVKAKANVNQRDMFGDAPLTFAKATEAQLLVGYGAYMHEVTKSQHADLTEPRTTALTGADPSLRENKEGKQTGAAAADKAGAARLTDNMVATWPILSQNALATKEPGQYLGVAAVARGAFNRGKITQPWSASRLDALLEREQKGGATATMRRLSQMASRQDISAVQREYHSGVSKWLLKGRAYEQGAGVDKDARKKLRIYPAKPLIERERFAYEPQPKPPTVQPLKPGLFTVDVSNF